jgi:hypothetical protein
VPPSFYITKRKKPASLRELEHTLALTEHKGEETGEDCTLSSIMICTSHRSFLLGSDTASACVVADYSMYRSAAIFKVIQSFKQECITLKLKM